VRIVLLTMCGLAVLAGCARNGGVARVDDQQRPVNRWIVETLDDESVANAVVRQHTIFPYHFYDSAPDLNELGERDVRILARHFARYPGELNIRRGGEGAEIYNSRVQRVTAMLTRLGVPQGSITTGDKLPGGDGIVAERALIILKRSNEPAQLREATPANEVNNGSNTGSGV
jgi:hypothetical protein